VLSKPETPKDIKEGITTQIQESSARDVQTDIAGPALIALFGDASLRQEWLTALAEDMLSSKNLDQVIRKLLLRVLYLLTKERALYLLTEVAEGYR
jgi:hypothetical protein